MNTTLPEMTERQAAGWLELVAEAQRYVDTSTITTDIKSHDWTTRWSDEVRPGRGHDLSATYCDGEYLVYIMVGVYGFGQVGVGEVTWVHSSSDEECRCEPCRADDEGSEQ